MATTTCEIAELIGERATRVGRRPALAQEGRTVSHGQLDADADAVAGALVAAGVQDGQAVAIIGGNQPWVVAALVGTWRAGAVAVPLGARLRAYDLANVLADLRPAAICTSAAHGGVDMVGLLAAVVADLPDHSAVLVADQPTGTPRLVSPATAGASAPALDGDIGAVAYTSGTTGAPRGALVRHTAMARAARHLADVLALGEDDTTALAVPWNHAFGLGCLLAALVAGGAVALVDRTRTTQALRRAIAHHDARVVHGAPMLFAALLRAPGHGTAGGRGFVAGAVCPPELLRDLDEQGLRILNLFGMTELGAVTTTRLEDPPEVRHHTVGRPVCDYQVRVADGELQVRGPNATPGYLGRPQDTAAAHDHGWFRTGDVASIQPDGTVIIQGRRKEIVHVAGFNVFPAEVEGLLLTHPQIAAAAVVGVDAPDSGEALAAFVVPADDGLTAADVVTYARSRVAGHKVPYRVHLVGELPRLSSGKPDRAALREQLREPA